jgi:hypothetical protein
LKLEFPHSQPSSALVHEKFCNRARVYLTLCVHFVGYRTRSQALHTYCFPERLAAALLEDAGTAQMLMDKAKTAWHAIVEAERLSEDPHCPYTRDIRRLLKDMHFVQYPLVREFCLICEHAGWDCESDTVRDIVFSLFCGRGNTKLVLEDTFQRLRFVERSIQNSRLAYDRVFFEAWHTPKLPHVVSEDGDDYTNLAVTSDDRSKNLPLDVVGIDQFSYAMYSVSKEAKIDNLDIAALVKKEAGCEPWRPGGPVAMRRMTAAAAFLEMDSQNGFANVRKAWCCALMGAGLVYQQQHTGKVFLSLGHDKWVWYGYELRVLDEVDGTFLSLRSPHEHPVQFLMQVDARLTFFRRRDFSDLCWQFASADGRRRFSWRSPDP